jgi:hypothetical protein
MTKLKSGLTWASSLGLSFVLVVSSVATLGWVAYGSPWSIPALARGRVVIARPGVVSLGQIEVGHRYAVAVELVNLSASPVTVIGYQSNCTCVSVAQDFPIDLPARKSHRFSLLIVPKGPQAGKPLAETIYLYLNVPSAQTSISVEGTVARLTASP